MSTDTSRKFILRALPDVTGIERTSLERHFLFIGDGVELRIQTNGVSCTLMRKVARSELSRDTEQWELTRAEFEQLRKAAVASIWRESYRLPEATVRIYSGPFAGLMRAEFGFGSDEEARAFIPPDWVGPEITTTALARDSRLLALSPEEFAALLAAHA